MTAQPIEANVVLTADNSQYDQAMVQSAGSTNTLAKSIDSLGAKINNLTKSAGRKLLGITAADVALIGGATAAWASYEKQMSRLQAQSAIIGRNRDQETKIMKEYTGSVRELRKEFGTTTAEAAQLTQSISKLADNTRGIKELSTTFTQMSQATGESSSGLATSLLNLQKIMGTPQAQTKNYADQLTYLAASSNTTATALADFSSQIAPLGRAMGMTQTEVVGFSNMFIKAGQDGYTAATAFNKVAQDITQAVQTGSPDLAKYANTLGVTVEQFQNMSGAEQVAGFLDQISRLGPKAAQELSRFGFDGVRMSKSITAAVQSSGGAMTAIREAQIGYGSDATTEGAKAANTMTDTLAKLRQELQQTAEAFGKAFGPGVGLVLKGVEQIAGAFETLMEGPLGKFIQIAAAVVVPVTAIGGAMLLLAGTIVKVAAGFALLRNSGALGLMEGLRGGSRIVPGGPMGFQAAGGGYLGPHGAQLAERGTWFQRGLYNAGQQAGGAARLGAMTLGGTPLFAGAAGGGASPFSRGAGAGVRFIGQSLSAQFDQMRYANPADRQQFFQRYFPGTAPGVSTGVMDAQDKTTAARVRAQQASGVFQSLAATQGIAPDKVDQAKKDMHRANQAAAAMERQEKATIANATAQSKAAQQIAADSKAAQGVNAAVRGESANLARALGGAAAGAARFAATTAAAGAKSLMAGLGGPVGLGLTALMMAPMAIAAGKKIFGEKDQEEFDYKDLGAAGAPYLAAAGVTPPVVGGGYGATAPTAPTTVAAARRIDATKVASAKAVAHKLADKNLYGLDEKQVTAYLGQNFGRFSKDPAAMDSMVMDLIDKFGPEPAERILKNLESGDYAAGPDVFLAAAKGADNDKDRNKYLNIAAMMEGGVIASAGEKEGPTGAIRERAKAVAGQVRAAFGGGDDAEAALDILNEKYGLNLSEDEVQGIRQGTGLAPQPFSSAGPRPLAKGALQRGIDLTKGTDVQATQALIETTTQANRESMLGAMNIPLQTKGDDLTKALTAALTGVGTTAETPEAALSRRTRGTGKGGRLFEGDRAVDVALEFGSTNISKNIDAVSSFMDHARDVGMSAPQIDKAMLKIKSELASPDDPRSVLASWVQERAQQQMAIQMPMMTRAGAFGAQVDMFQKVASVKATTPELQANRDEEYSKMASAMVDQVQYFKQLLIAQEQFDKQRRRAQEDYNLQRQYQEQDYNLQRQRAEESYQRMRNRATADYYRGVRRAHYDFNLQRSRTEADYNHSIEVQAKQAAQSVYSIYDRVQAERTHSASWILSNAQDQLERMQEQSENLDKLRARGLSTSAIQQLGFNDPKNAQQLAAFLTEATPAMIKQANKIIGTERVKAARDLVTDTSSLTWQEQERGHRIALHRNTHDFKRSMRINNDDFKRNLDRQENDFDLMMSQQADDYEKGMDRQEKAYKQTMDRAAEDMGDMAREISLTMEQVLIESSKKLSGSAGKQADQVLKHFQDLKKTATPEAEALMKELAETFGFDYKPPKRGGGGDNTPTYSHMNRPGESDLNRASGGVIPGWTPGRDTTTANVSGGEAVMRPEWTRAVGESAINAMNHQAKYGGFAAGGVFWPVPGHTTGTYPGHDGVDINRGSGSDDLGDPIRAFRSGTITYVGSGHGYGDAIFERTAAGTVVYGHTSGQNVHTGQVVRAGQLIGQVGSTGHSSSPHLHFGIPGGSYAQAMALLQGAIVGGGGFAGMGLGDGDLSGILRKRYPRAERAAADMAGVHPLEPGMISQVINRFARRKIRSLGGGGGLLSGGADIGHQPHENLTNEQIVHVGANRLGWGNQWSQLHELVMHESGFNNTAQNPDSTAYGMFQFLDGTWGSYGGHKTSDPWKQTQYGLRYIKQRYDDPRGAWDFWQDNNWYKDGAVFDGARRIGVGENGPEAVIPLNARGADFMTEVMAHTMGSRNVTPMGGGMSVYNTKIDRSTNFTGPIMVQANDPAELINKLQARQRVMALSRPALTGSAA